MPEENIDKVISKRKDVLLEVVTSKWFNIIVGIVVLGLFIMVILVYWKVVFAEPCELCEMYYNRMCVDIRDPIINPLRNP